MKTFPCAAVEVKNEPILGFKEGSAERKELLKVVHLTLRDGAECALNMNSK